MPSQTIRKFIYAAAAAVLVSGIAQAGSSGWVRVAPAGGAFSAAMPETPEDSAQPIREGSLSTTMHTYKTASEGCVYAVSYLDLPVAIPARQALEGIRNGNVEGGRLVSERDFTMNGNPAKSVSFEKNGLTFYNQIILVNTRIYQVMFVMASGEPTPESAGSFYRSFQLLN